MKRRVDEPGYAAEKMRRYRQRQKKKKEEMEAKIAEAIFKTSQTLRRRSLAESDDNAPSSVIEYTTDLSKFIRWLVKKNVASWGEFLREKIVLKTVWKTIFKIFFKTILRLLK